jgi:hypothetical protein
MIRKSMLVLALAALLVALTAVAAAGAAAPGQYKITHFKVEVKGIQKTVQTFHHKPEGECDISDNSTITEKVVFQSTPKLMTFYDAPGELNPIVLFDKAGKWPTKATVTRHYTPRIVTPPPSPKCGENDGGGEEVVPLDDCGTKKLPSWEIHLEYDKRKKDGFHVFGGEEAEPLFNNCLAPAGDLGFPFLILEDTHEKPILAELPKDEVFDPGIGKLIGLASGTQRVEEPSLSAKVSIEWDVSLTRIGGVKVR